MGENKDRDISKNNTELYRHFDKDGRLLYVGISLSAASRLAQHKSASSWFKHITRIEVERFATRPEAIRAERKAIKSERPIFNVAMNRGGIESYDYPPSNQVDGDVVLIGIERRGTGESMTYELMPGKRKDSYMVYLDGEFLGDMGAARLTEHIRKALPAFRNMD